MGQSGERDSTRNDLLGGRLETQINRDANPLERGLGRRHQASRREWAESLTKYAETIGVICIVSKNNLLEERGKENELEAFCLGVSNPSLPALGRIHDGREEGKEGEKKRNGRQLFSSRLSQERL